MTGYSEDELVEQPAIALFKELGWEHVNAFGETWVPGGGTLGRETSEEVVLVPRLRAKLIELNKDVPGAALRLAGEELLRSRSAMTAAAASREMYGLLKNGVAVTTPVDGRDETFRVRFVDWESPEKNDYLLASQFWVSGEIYKRRCDLVGFVNGIPLVFLELKASHRRMEYAFERNLRDYKNTIPQIFWYNAFILLSNGSQSVVGTVTAGWEHFAEWKKINSEGEEGVVSLDTVIRATCEPSRLLDIAENFLLYEEARGGLVKVVAKNHQYLGVNNAVAALAARKPKGDSLGVFWHTQGAGKSYSMMFFAQKVLRKLPGTYTFVILTDRVELDDQIYGTFQRCGVITEKRAQAESSAHLRELLQEDHRYIFTLVQKFRTASGQTHPVVSERSDIIVITDEAHRSQYDTYAANMRTALPNAAFIAFTGTPLLAGEEKTREVFGDYVSVYDFVQSVEDGATVPLFYENRIPELQLTNQDLQEEMIELIEDADLSEEEERALERAFSRQYNLITNDERLETIAKDIVDHFFNRGFRGKAMVVSIDKATAVRMYEKVRKHWREYVERLESPDDFALTTDMAVVVSQSQNEVEDLERKGADIRPHRQRMVKEDLAENFKDPDNPLRIVFVCAMWMTGFDAPACSTIYLDKPMRNHTLMQTIARANRVFPGKDDGLIVDYIGVFRDLQKALSIYAPAGHGEMPIKDKAALVESLRQAVGRANTFLTDAGVDVEAIIKADGFDKVGLMDDAVDAILVNEESKTHFSSLASAADRAFRAVMPDPATNEFRQIVTLLNVLKSKMEALTPQVDVAEVMQEVEELLEESVAAEPYRIAEGNHSGPIDLTRLDFDAVREQFNRGRKHTQAEKLKGEIAVKLTQMVRLNRSRINYLDRFQQMIEEYNAGSINVQLLFEELLSLARDLGEEDSRAVAEGLSEEELAVFDLLTKPEVKLSEKDELDVKRIARELLDTLKREKLVLDWRKRQQSRAAVRVCIEEKLDALPDTYTSELYASKCNVVYEHVYDSYFGDGQGVYEEAA